MAQVKVQLRTMPRDESFFSRGLELQSLVRSEVGICSSSDHGRGYQQQQQPLSYAVSSTSFVSISPMRTFKQSRGNMYATSQQHQLLPSTENVGVGMMKQHVYHHASSTEDTQTTSNKMSRATFSDNQDNTPTLYCQCHPLCREVSNPYGTKLYLQDSPNEKIELSSTPLALGKKMGDTCLTNPTIQEQLNFSANKKSSSSTIDKTCNTNTSTTSPPGQLYLHAAGLPSATSTPLHDKFVFSDMTEIDPSTSTGISSPSKKQKKDRSTTKVASKWSEVPFKAKKTNTNVKSSSRTVSSSVKAKKKMTNVKSSVSSAAKKVSPKPPKKHTTRGSKKASTLTITSPTDTSVEKASSAAKKVSLKPPQLQKVTTRGSKEAYIDSPTDVDVLCGSGGSFNRHKGNVRFRDYVSQMRSVYQQARKVDKKALSEVSSMLFI